MSKFNGRAKKENKKILPLIMALGNKIITEIGLAEKTDTAVKWDRGRWNVTSKALTIQIIPVPNIFRQVKP